ncbi:hypothetical protein C8J57DRAFT_1468344 [Mycena rebaudengoi]|nr:hypothetical protein C8J57DRAFT_1468344 [Mycena rebaudengoi]
MFTLPDITTLLSVSTGQPVGSMFELMMGCKAGGFGLYSESASSAPYQSAVPPLAQPGPSLATPQFLSITPSRKSTNHCSAGSRSTPNATLLSTAIQVLLELIYLGSSAAFDAFVGVSGICLGFSNAMPVAVSLANGRRNVADSPSPLGRFGFALNAMAIVGPRYVDYDELCLSVFIFFMAVGGVVVFDHRFHYKGPNIPEVTQHQEDQAGENKVS